MRIRVYPAMGPAASECYASEMIDVVDSRTRSRMMAAIRGRNTRPELALRSALHRLGFRFRVHRKDLPGTPDIVLPSRRVAILVNGCFWHRHPGCRFATTPATRPEFWAAKFAANVERDRRSEMRLAEAGWRVAVVWECSVRRAGADPVAARLADWIRSDGRSPFLSIGREDVEP